ncbi:MAG TPA: hypothetical protein V6C81_09225 [Planktothrix sp.]|jgi:hypothetical protein
MLKIGLALTFSATLLFSPLIAGAQEIPGLEPLAAPGTPGGPSAGGVPGLVANAAPFVPPADMQTSNMGYRNPFGTIPKIGPDFWKGSSMSRINPGTVLTGVLEDQLSSSKSKVGDVFVLRLEDGFPVDSDKQLIPKMSKIVGTVMRTAPAHSQKHSMPGQMDVSVQTLVFPDGSTTPIFGYIEHNPAQDLHDKPGTQMPNPARLGAQTLRGALSLVTGRVGMNIRMPIYGQDFKLDKGEAIPIRLSRPLDVGHMTPPPQQTAQTPNMFQPTPSGPPSDAILPESGPTAGSSSKMAPMPGLAPGVVPGLAPSNTVPPVAPPILKPMQPQADLPDPF